MDEAWNGEVRDEADARPIRSTLHQFTGRVWSVRTDEVEFDDGVLAQRDVMLHPGAVAVIALDDRDRVLLLRQYRHPVAASLFEPPAGLLDHDGEAPLRTAERELAEEAGYAAARWDVLVDLLNSPGGSSEAIRVYLARDLTPLPGGRVLTGEAEEAHLPRVWVPVEEARDLVLSGAISSPSAVCGILAAAASREGGWASLRPADSTWPAHERVRDAGRLPGSAGRTSAADTP